MAGKTFTTMVELEGYIEHLCAEAIRHASQRICAQLKLCIDEQYYKDPLFYPNVYRRTETFLKSATYTLLNSKSSKIYVDGDGMSYKNNFDPWQIVDWASESKHGADYYQTTTKDFWSTFIEWCDENAINILKEELKKKGITLSK